MLFVALLDLLKNIQMFNIIITTNQNFSYGEAINYSVYFVGLVMK